MQCLKRRGTASVSLRRVAEDVPPAPRSAAGIDKVVSNIKFEVAAVYELAHSNIVALKDVIASDCMGLDVPMWIVMELCDGEQYEGGWRDDKRHGRGVHTRADGERY